MQSWNRLPASTSHVAELAVRRALPRRQCRAVGPFVFLDEMGPVTFPAGAGLDVGPHPHAGLATLTYLLDGALLHRDSLGSEQRIEPGQVNWMGAGAGVMHSERSPDREQAHRLHGLQFWLALPPAQTESAPWFVHHGASSLPERELDGVQLRVLAGEAHGVRARTELPYDALLLDVRLAAGAVWRLPRAQELALYVLEGALELEGEAPLGPGELAVAPREEAAWTVRAPAPTRLICLGGAALEAPRRMEWNFVALDLAQLAQIKARWAAGQFPPVRHDPG